MSETTTDRLAEIEGQAAEYTPPEGWRVLQVGEVLEDNDWIVDTRDGNGCPTMKAGSKVGDHQTVEHQIYIRPIESEPEPFITPDDMAAEALAGVHDSAVVANPFQALRELKRQLETTEAALLEQQQRNEQLVTQGSQQHMQIAELQAQVRFLKDREVTLGTRLEEEKAVNAKRLQQVEELRSEVSYVQGLLGESRQRVTELEELVGSLRTINRGCENAVRDAGKENTALRNQLEAVKADLAQVSRDRYLLQIELDAREQVPEAVSDRFDQGFEQGTARAVETIAEWLEPLRQMIEKADNLVESDRASRLCAEIMQSLPAIMRSLTGLADED